MRLSKDWDQPRDPVLGRVGWIVLQIPCSSFDIRPNIGRGMAKQEGGEFHKGRSYFDIGPITYCPLSLYTHCLLKQKIFSISILGQSFLFTVAIAPAVLSANLDFSLSANLDFSLSANLDFSLSANLDFSLSANLDWTQLSSPTHVR